MSVPDNNVSVHSRIITAFFDTAGAARQAREDLVAAGIPHRHIHQTGGRGSEVEGATTAEAGSFWESLKDFFLPAEDRHAYAEGLDRGGFLLKVDVDEANYNRVIDILDTDGAIDMDKRETDWRSQGWTGFSGSDRSNAPSSGLATASILSAGATAPAVPSSTATPRETNWATDEAARRAAMGTATRDPDLRTSRLRAYRRDLEGGAGSASRIDASRITEHMEVISADGQRIGTVDHLDGPDRIKLTKASSPDGHHHRVPFTWIDHIDQHVHLNKTLAEIKAQQQA